MGDKNKRNKNKAPAQARAQNKADNMAGKNSAFDSAGNKVAVAFNHPQGIKFTVPGGRAVVINGNATHLRGKEKGVLPAGAFGLTLVDADDWEYITKVYGRMQIFKSGLIFAQDSRARAEDEAEEKRELRHGREAVDPAATNTEPVSGADLAGMQ
jgi:hypothetical protein